MSVLMCSGDHLSVMAIVASASATGVPALKQLLHAMREKAREHEAATAAGDHPAATQLASQRYELRALRTLWLANRRAFAERWGKEPDGEEPTISAADFDRLAEILTDPVAVLRLTARYEYQASAAPDWITCCARAQCDAAKAIAAQCLPGWESAPRFL